MKSYYKQIITLRENRNNLVLRCDSTLEYELSLSNVSNTEWWAFQDPSEIRHWQKDICVGMMQDALGSLDKFLIYQKGHGYNQNHDICLTRSQTHNIWCLSTYNDFWITSQTGTNIIFNRTNSLGSILEPSARKDIYLVMDKLKEEFNPNNLMLTMRMQ